MRALTQEVLAVARPRPTAPLRVLRLCSVFEAPPAALHGRAVRFDPVGGMQNHTACLTRALDALGVAQDVVTTRPPGAPARAVLGRAATVHRLGAPLATGRQLYALPAATALRRLARTAGVLHAHLGEDLAVVPLALAAARAAGIPLVLTVHMSLAHTLAPRGLRARALRAVGGALERAGVRRADAVIALTPRLAGVLRGAGAAPHGGIHVIPSGVVPREFGGAARDALAGALGPRVVYVGRLARQKGVDTLLDAAARLPEARLVIVGDGPERRSLERRAHRLGLDGRVTFRGFLAHHEVPGVLAAADVVVAPSRYEELGSILLEAMQAGAPIVATRVGGIPDAVGAAAVLVAPDDPGALAAGIARVLRNPEEAQRLRAAARARAGAYDWDVLARRVLAVYGRVAGGACDAPGTLDGRRHPAPAQAAR